MTRDELASCCVMIFDERGNAIESFDWTPEALVRAARRLRSALGEETTVTIGESAILAKTSA